MKALQMHDNKPMMREIFTPALKKKNILFKKQYTLFDLFSLRARKLTMR